MYLDRLLSHIVFEFDKKERVAIRKVIKRYASE